MPRKTLDERFWEKVDRGGPDDCWEWGASRNRQGYGFFWNTTGRFMESAHRVAYRLHHGQDPGGRLVCHHCDNPPCVNPAHLFLADQKENVADMRRKGRAARRDGTRNGRARLSRVDALIARTCYDGSHGQIAALARHFGVSHGAMSHLLHGRSWT